jgi:hypothetical protein
MLSDPFGRLPECQKALRARILNGRPSAKKLNETSDEIRLNGLSAARHSEASFKQLSCACLSLSCCAGERGSRGSQLDLVELMTKLRREEAYLKDAVGSMTWVDVDKSLARTVCAITPCAWYLNPSHLNVWPQRGNPCRHSWLLGRWSHWGGPYLTLAFYSGTGRASTSSRSPSS